MTGLQSAGPADWWASHHSTQPHPAKGVSIGEEKRRPSSPRDCSWAHSLESCRSYTSSGERATTNYKRQCSVVKSGCSVQSQEARKLAFPNPQTQILNVIDEQSRLPRDPRGSAVQAKDVAAVSEELTSIYSTRVHRSDKGRNALRERAAKPPTRTSSNQGLLENGCRIAYQMLPCWIPQHRGSPPLRRQLLTDHFAWTTRLGHIRLLERTPYEATQQGLKWPWIPLW